MGEPDEQRFYSRPSFSGNEQANEQAKKKTAHELWNKTAAAPVWMSASTSNGHAGNPISPVRTGLTLRANCVEAANVTVIRRARMSEKKKDELLHDHNHDGVDRRGFLECKAWAGAGALCVMKGGGRNSYSLSRISGSRTAEMVSELGLDEGSDRHMTFEQQ